MFFIKALEGYVGVEGARIVYRAKVEIGVHDENGAYADQKGESEQIVLLVKSGEECFVGT